MAWLSDNSSERVDQATYNYRIQYAVVNAEFNAQNPGAIETFGEGAEIVRRIRQNVVSYAWPGLTSEAAQAKLAELRGFSDYKNPTAKWNGAGGYDVTATRVRVDPNGWEGWVKVEDSEEEWSGE